MRALSLLEGSLKGEEPGDPEARRTVARLAKSELVAENVTAPGEPNSDLAKKEAHVRKAGD